jgi:hypothetical protein
MTAGAGDPYQILGVTQGVPDAELRRAYRDLVKRHHPDHNGGSAESAARFEQIQSAYASVVADREGAQSTATKQPTASNPAATPGDAALEQRIAAIERELAAKREAKRRTREASGAEAKAPKPPTQEELGHYETDDSLGKIVDDAAEELAKRLRGGSRSEFARRLTDLFGGRDE